MRDDSQIRACKAFSPSLRGAQHRSNPVAFRRLRLQCRWIASGLRTSQRREGNFTRAALIALWFVILSMACWIPISFADATDRSKEAQLEADQVDFSAKTHQGIYHGHVTFIQGSSHLEADDAQTRFDEHNQIDYAKATSSAGRTAHFWTKIKPNEPDFHAYAKQIEYFPKKHLIVLTGDAQILQGNNKMSSPVIEYDISAQHLVTRSTEKVRTRLYIYPENKHE